MNIDLVAQQKNTESFMHLYRTGDEKKIYDGRSLIFYSLSNSCLSARYEVSTFLLDKNVDTLGSNYFGQTALHVLLEQVEHNVHETVELCKRLLQSGVNINAVDRNGQTALTYIARINKTDRELEEVYKLWLSHSDLNVCIVDKTGCTVFDYIKKYPYRAELIKRLEQYGKIC